jgi:hypothetical protein
MICSLHNCNDLLHVVFDADITVGDFLGLCVQKKKLSKICQILDRDLDSLKHTHTSNKR